MPDDPKPADVSTGVIRTETKRSHYREHATPIFMTSSFVFESAEHARDLFAGDADGHIYSRYGNPNVDEFVNRICVLERSPAGIALASGMSAIFTPLAALLNSGDHVIASRSVFGSTHQILTNILPRWGISHSYADAGSVDTWHELMNEDTRMCILETPSNPVLAVIDIRAVADICRERGVILLVDNAFATPFIQTPLTLGADLVMHSATKYIDGMGRGIGGVVVGRKPIVEQIRMFARHTGPTLSPFNAWMFSRSLETLALRMDRHSSNALHLARWLQTSSDVDVVLYPHLESHPQYELARRQMCTGGGIVTFVAKGGADRAGRFLDQLRLCSLTANLGDTRTIALHPASTTHATLTDDERRQVGIKPGMIRISVGLEDADDIVADIAQALVASTQ